MAPGDADRGGADYFYRPFSGQLQDVIQDCEGGILDGLAPSVSEPIAPITRQIG
jgi:hypothetical protein